MQRNPTIVFPAPHEVVIEERPMPSPQPGQVLVRSRCTLVSTGTELTILSGDFPPSSTWARYGQFPFLPGYDNVGEVIGVGPDVDHSWIGQRVGSYGGHAQYVTAAAEALRPVPGDISDEHAAFFTIAEIVMNGVRRGGVQFGEAVVVYGLGLLGQLTARFCRLCGARPVVAVDVASSRLDRLPAAPSILPVDPRQHDVVSVVREATKGRMADVAFEVTGDPGVIPQEAAPLREQGRLVILSSPRGATEFDFHDLCNSPSFMIIGAHNRSHPQHESLGNPWTNKRHAELFFDLVRVGELDLEPLISHRESYTEAARLYHMLLEDRSRAMGVVLLWG